LTLIIGTQSADEHNLMSQLVEITDIELIGAGRCFGALDLGPVRDLTAFALFWPETGYLKVWTRCPTDNLQKREETDRVP
jgi:hypothetical protein